MELIVHVTDQVNPDPKLDKGCYKKGHVVFAVPDGHPWSKEELANPNWRIIRVSLLNSTVDALLAPENGDPQIKTLRRRKFRIDISQLDLPYTKEIKDFTRRKITDNIQLI